MTEPTDKSIPAVSMTSVIPPAITPTAAALLKIVIILLICRKGRPSVDNSIAKERTIIAIKAPDHS